MKRGLKIQVVLLVEKFATKYRFNFERDRQEDVIKRNNSADG